MDAAKYTPSNHIRWAITVFLKEDCSPWGMAFQSVMVLGQKLYLFLSVDILIGIIRLPYWFLVVRCWTMTWSSTCKAISPVRALWRMFSLWTLRQRAKGGHSKSAKIRVTVPSVLSLFPVMNRAAFLCMPPAFSHPWCSEGPTPLRHIPGEASLACSILRPSLQLDIGQRSYI